MSYGSSHQQIDSLRARTRQLTLSYAQQALDDLENFPVVSTDPRGAAQRAETWGEIIDTLGKISDQLDRVERDNTQE